MSTVQFMFQITTFMKTGRKEDTERTEKKQSGRPKKQSGFPVGSIEDRCRSRSYLSSTIPPGNTPHPITLIKIGLDDCSLTRLPSSDAVAPAVGSVSYSPPLNQSCPQVVVMR